MILENEFLLTSLLIILSPGAGTIITLSAGLRQGARGAIITAAGCTFGVLPHMLAAVTGLAALLHTSPVFFSLVKYTGAAYLLYMAWQTIRDKGLLSVDSMGATLSSYSLIKQSVVANLLNPKLSLFFLAFLPQFIAVHDVHPTRSMLILSAIFAAMTFVVFTLYGIFASGLSHMIVEKRGTMTCIRWVTALAFTAVGIKLALTGQ